MWGMDCPPPAAAGLAMAQKEGHPHILDDRTSFFWQYEDADPNFSQVREIVELFESVRLTPEKHWYDDSVPSSQEPEEEDCNFKNRKTHALASPIDASCSSSTGNPAPVILLDSGAGHHAVGDAGILTDLHDPPPGSTVIVADGFQLPVDKTGVIQTPDIRIPDVYLVPGLQVNLVSVRQLAKSNVVTTFYENHAELWREGEQVGGAIADNDTSLYRLCFFRPNA